MKIMLFWTVLLFGLFNPLSGKKVTSKVSLAKIEREMVFFLGKFKFNDLGQFSLSFKTDEKYSENPSLSVEKAGLWIGFFDEANFELMEKKSSCKAKKALSKTEYRLPMSKSEETNISYDLKSDLVGGKYSYFMLFDCQNAASKFYSQGSQFEFTLEMKNINSHHQAGEEYYIYDSLLTAALFITLLLSRLKLLKKEMAKLESADPNYPFILVNICLIMKIIHLFLYAIDHFLTGRSGLNNEFLSFSSQALNQLSHYLLAALLILLAVGWQILFYSLETLDTTGPLLILIGIVRVLLVGVGKGYENTPEYSHQFDSIAGWILVATDIGLFCFFIYSAFESAMKTKFNKAVELYFIKLGILGSAYFLLFPLLVVLALLFEKEHRHRFVELGHSFFQFIALALASFLTGSSTRGLRKLQSAVLPETG